MNAPAVLELPLDDALLKVLSSESRREILRLLRERRMTGAELATRLDLGKPAVAEHLKKLQEAELIERFDDPERRWVYYNLSARGRGILEPQRVRFYLVMAVAALGLMVGVALALGLVVLMQGAPAGAGPIPDDPAALDGNSLGGLGSPDVGAGTALPAGTATAPSATTTTAAPAAPSVYQGPPRAPTPIGGTEPIAPSAQAAALLIDPQSVPPRPPTQSAAVPMVLVYRAQDIDAVNHTVQVRLIPFNATALAEANLTEAVQSAAIVPDVGLVLVVPDGTPLPESANDTVILTFSEPVAEPAPPVATNATAPATGQSASEPAPSSQAHSAQDTATPSATSASTAPAPVASSTPTVAPTSAPPMVMGQGASPGTAGQTQPPAGAGSSGGQNLLPEASSGAKDLQAGEAQGPGVGTDVGATAPVATASGKAAPIPLVALLAAALMVSVYLPNRRK